MCGHLDRNALKRCVPFVQHKPQVSNRSVRISARFAVYEDGKCALTARVIAMKRATSFARLRHAALKIHRSERCCLESLVHQNVEIFDSLKMDREADGNKTNKKLPFVSAASSAVC